MRLLILGLVCLLSGIVYAADIQPLGQADAEDRAAQSTADRLERENARAAREQAERKAEAERLAKEAAERKAAEEEAARIAAQQRVEAERLAAERAAQTEAERLAAERAEAERLAQEEAGRKAAQEAERLAKEEADRKAAEEEAARIAAERAEAERLAQQEAERKAAEEARLARERAEREAAEAEAQRIAAEKAEAERLAAEKAARDEAERQVAEAEAERLAQEESDRLAQEQAEREEAEAEAARLAAEQEARDEAERQAAESAGQDAAEHAAASTASEETVSTAQDELAEAGQPIEEAAIAEDDENTVAAAAPSGADGPGSGSTGGDGSGLSGEPEIASSDTLSGTAAPGGPISQQACTALGAPDHCPEVNTALARITERPARFDLPSEMSFADTASIDMAFLSNLQAGELPSDLAGFVGDLPDNAKQAFEKLAGTFTVKLTSDGFDISPEGPQTLNADAGNLAGLNWQLTPSKDGGDQSIKIQLFAAAPDGQGGTSEVLIKSFDSVIRVHLSAWDQIKIYINAYLPYFLMIGALLLAMISLLVFPRKSRDGDGERSAFATAGAGGGAAAASDDSDAAPVRNSGPVIGDLDQSASDGPVSAPSARHSGSTEPSAAGTAIGAATAATVVAALDDEEEEPPESADESPETAGGMAAETYDEISDETAQAASEFPEAGAIEDDLTEEGEAEDVYAGESAPPQYAETPEPGGGDLPIAGNDDDPNAATPPRAANDDEPKSA